MNIYANKISEAKQIGFEYPELERLILLKTVDKYWMDHIDAMNILQHEIGLKAFGQQDPVSAYKRESSFMFDNMIEKIWEEVTVLLLNIKVDKVSEEKIPKPAPFVVNKETNNSNAINATGNRLAQRNDPCPCGSGKKYKNCCGAK